tara:strand:- start:6565 stop:7713 length:1149 start_codon:yes stop_codon:yes gene_type:complete
MELKFLDSFIDEVKKIYKEPYTPLHRPVFDQNEKDYLIECIDSNFVSSVGQKVKDFENSIIDFTGAKYAIATVNGTSALHLAMLLAGVKAGDEVITQSLTFVATCNAIAYANAIPVFIDVNKDTMGMSPDALECFLKENAKIKDGKTYNNKTGKRISACVPMHTFGMPLRIKEISAICNDWGISVVEDAAESLGSFFEKKHTGTFGELGTLSFNGNKIITTGGGGMIITNDEKLAIKAKHLSTTAKITHPYEYSHDMVGYNYRLPNINAALGCAQMLKIKNFLEIKKDLSNHWKNYFGEHNVDFCTPIKGAKSNNWLHAILLNSKKERDIFIEYTNKNNVMTRPIWKLMSDLPMFSECQRDSLKNSKWLAERVVNIPSSIPA